MLWPLAHICRRPVGMKFLEVHAGPDPAGQNVKLRAAVR
jgi:hypothetical protein